MAGEGGGPGKREQGPDHVGLVRNRREFGVYLRAIGTNWMIRSRVRPDLTWAFKGPRDSVKHRLKGPGMEAVGGRQVERVAARTGPACGRGATCSATRPTWQVGLSGFAEEGLRSRKELVIE